MTPAEILVYAFIGVGIVCGFITGRLTYKVDVEEDDLPEPEIVVRRSEPLAEGQLASALTVPDENGVWRAVMQILDEESEGCASSAQASVGNYGVCAGFVGGQEICGRIRQRMLSLRESGKQAVPK